MASEPDPQWPREAWRGLVHEWRDYGRVVLAVTREPRRFMHEWADGRRAALNPLACMLNLIALITVMSVAVHQIAHVSDDETPWHDLLKPIIRLVFSSALASTIHVPLRFLGAQRPWRTTLAAVLYVTAGPLLPLYLVRSVLFQKIVTGGTTFAVFAIAIWSVLVIYLVLALSSAHGVPWWRVLLAFVIGMGVAIVIAIAFTTLGLTFSF
jgi:hypothetical protein